MRYHIGQWVFDPKPQRLTPAQIAWCIARGIFKRDLLADHFADAGKMVAS